MHILISALTSQLHKARESTRSKNPYHKFDEALSFKDKTIIKNKVFSKWQYLCMYSLHHF